MPDLPIPIQANNITELVTQMSQLMEDLYQDRVGGALLGDVFEIGADDILAVNLYASGGIQKVSGELAVLPKPTGGIDVDANGIYVKCKSGGGLSTSADGIEVTDLATIEVANGGTGLTSLTPYALLTGGMTATADMQQVSGVGDAGDILTSQGAAALPTWEAPTKPVRIMEIIVIDGWTNCFVTDGAAYFRVPVDLNGMNLIGVAATCNVTGTTGTMDIQLNRKRTTAVIGGATTQFDITNTAGNTYRYTYDGTGTDPGIANSDASLRTGDSMDIQAQNFTAANNGRFTLTAVGTNYFEITNASGVAENNKTIGTGAITPTKFRDMLSTKITIDSGEWDSSTAATPAVINASYDDVLTADVIRIDIDDLHDVVIAQGLIVEGRFQAP